MKTLFFFLILVIVYQVAGFATTVKQDNQRIAQQQIEATHLHNYMLCKELFTETHLKEYGMDVDIHAIRACKDRMN